MCCDQCRIIFGAAERSEEDEAATPYECPKCGESAWVWSVDCSEGPVEKYRLWRTPLVVGSQDEGPDRTTIGTTEAKAECDDQSPNSVTWTDRSATLIAPPQKGRRGRPIRKVRYPNWNRGVDSP